MRLVDAEPIEKWLLSHADQVPGKDPYRKVRICAYRHAFKAVHSAPTVAAAYCYPAATQPPNDPLTLKDLREMEGEPVYDALEDQWCVVEDVNYYDEFYSQIVMTDGTMLDTNEDGASCFLGRLYRRKPEEDRGTVPPKTEEGTT